MNALSRRICLITTAFNRAECCVRESSAFIFSGIPLFRPLSKESTFCRNIWSNLTDGSHKLILHAERLFYSFFASYKNLILLSSFKNPSAIRHRRFHFFLFYVRSRYAVCGFDRHLMFYNCTAVLHPCKVIFV